MKKVISYVLMLAVVGLLNVSCAKDIVNAACSTAVSALSQSYLTALNAFNADPTSSVKCNAAKSAGTAFINGIKGCSAYDQSGLAALEALNALPCP